jgi:hypothetical protein
VVAAVRYIGLRHDTPDRQTLIPLVLSQDLGFSSTDRPAPLYFESRDLGFSSTDLLPCTSSLRTLDSLQQTFSLVLRILRTSGSLQQAFSST